VHLKNNFSGNNILQSIVNPVSATSKD